MSEERLEQFNKNMFELAVKHSVDLTKMEKEIAELEKKVEALEIRLSGSEKITAKEFAELKEQIQSNYERIQLHDMRITELKEKFGNYISSNQFYHVLSNYAQKKEITELKEKIKIWRESDRMQINANLDGIDDVIEGWKIHNEVLRELIKVDIDGYKDYLPSNCIQEMATNLLKKLDGDSTKDGDIVEVEIIDNERGILKRIIDEGEKSTNKVVVEREDLERWKILISILPPEYLVPNLKGILEEMKEYLGGSEGW